MSRPLVPLAALGALLPSATIAVGGGMLIAGVAVGRLRRWAGWHRWAPLMCGLYPVVVIFPSFAIAGRPNFLVLSGWGMCWVLLAVALWAGLRPGRPVVTPGAGRAMPTPERLDTLQPPRTTGGRRS